MRHPPMSRVVLIHEPADVTLMGCGGQLCASGGVFAILAFTMLCPQYRGRVERQ